MGVKLDINQSAIAKKLEEAQKTMIDKVVRVLKYCGEMAVNDAKTNAGYKDQTGNLKSSIGYVIAVNGVVTEEYFPSSINSQGENIGKNLAYAIARQNPQIVLVVVAGMKYASHVESRGYNVIASAEQLAQRIVPNLIKQLK